MIVQPRLIRRPTVLITARLWRVNWFYVLLLCALASVGYVALYSAGGAPELYANRHIIRFAVALVMMLAIGMVDLRLIERLAWPLYGFSVGLLVLVLRIGHVGKGAQRWIMIGGQEMQPSELMKIALVLALAHWFHKASHERIGNPLFVLPPVLMILLPVGLILKEPNLGTAVITALVGGAVMLASGVRLWKFALVMIGAGIAAPLAYSHLHDYQRARITTFLNPESDPLGAGYNIIQSRIALGSGGMWGQGWLQGSQGHLNFLPEKQTDFIFAMIGEEFGFVGAAALMALLMLIVLGGVWIALRSRNQFGRLVALGISFNFFMYAVVNIAMVMGAIPVGGVPLPLVSHGGSAMLTVMFGFGILMSVHVHRDSTAESD